MLKIKAKKEKRIETWLCRFTSLMDFPGGSDGKASAYSAGHPGSIPGWGRSGKGNGNPLQYNNQEQQCWNETA